MFNSYAQAFNKQQRRSGTLFGGRVRSVLVDTDEYVLHLSRYIHLNPVRAGLVENPGDWPYSNYLEWLGRRNGTLVDHEFVRWYFPTPTEYETFVLGDLNPSLEEKLQVYYLD